MSTRGRTQAHILARYWYCAEQGRLLFLGHRTPRTEAISRGSRVHDWLESRPKSKSEERLWGKLEDVKPFFGERDGIRVYIHPDDLYLDGKHTTVEEYKTIGYRSGLSYFERFSKCCAENQVRTYIWVMRPILEELGYHCSDWGIIKVYSGNGRFLKKYPVHYREAEYLAELDGILRVYRGEEMPVRPNRLKCKQCKSPFRERCRIRDAGAQD